MMNFIERFKILPKSTKNLLGIGIVLALVVALPLFIWAIITQKFLIQKKAATGEPTPSTYCNRYCDLSIPGVDCLGGLVCHTSEASGSAGQRGNSSCRNPQCLDDLDCVCASPTPTPVVCNRSCSLGGETPVPCPTGFTCRRTSNLEFEASSSGICRKSACVTEIDCDCSTPTPTPRPPDWPTLPPKPTPTVTPTVTPTPTPTATPNPANRPFEILFKFQGVSDDAASYAKLGENRAKVAVKFSSQSLGYTPGYTTTTSIPVDYVSSGVYKLAFSISSEDLPAANDYVISLKGEKHISVRFCQATAQIQHCSGAGTIVLPAEPTTPVQLNFTGIPLPPGDVYQQDGVVNAADFNKIFGLMAKPCANLTTEDKMTGDLNYSGCVTVADTFLIRQTLETRYDES
jgi:hypothetical protein